MIQKYINLDPTFDPFGIEGMLSQQILFSNFTFKGGEPHIKIIPPHIEETLDNVEVIISIRIDSYNKLGLLQIAMDALRGIGFRVFHLVLPYFPGARQDRRMIQGEPFTSAVYVKALSALNFTRIASVDLHSDVIAGMFAVLPSPQLFEEKSNHIFVEGCIKDIVGKDDIHTNLTIISPDAGSNKKIKSLGMYLATEKFAYPVIKCDKTRNVSTGEITGFEVYLGNLEERDAIIVDDICDGGGTFLGLAKELKLRGAKRIFLVVTHGIFSKGPKILTDVFDGVYCTNSCDPLKYHEGNKPSNLHIKPLKFKI